MKVVVERKTFGSLRDYEHFKYGDLRYFKTTLVTGETVAKPLPHQGLPKPPSLPLKAYDIVEIEAEDSDVLAYERFMAKWRAKKGEWIKDGF